MAQQISFNVKLAWSIVVLSLIVTFRLVLESAVSDNLNGLIITVIHIAVVASASYWALRS